MKQFVKRWISFLLAVVMVSSMLPVQVFAGAAEEETVNEETVNEEILNEEILNEEAIGEQAVLTPEEDTAVIRVQQLIDALPTAVATQEEALALEALLAEVDAAMEELMEDQLAQLDLTAYQEATAALEAFVSDSEEEIEEEPVQEEPVQEEPVQEEPVQEEPVQEEPVQEEPGQEESEQEETEQDESLQQSALSLTATSRSSTLSDVTVQGTKDNNNNVVVNIVISRHPAVFASDEVGTLASQAVSYAAGLLNQSASKYTINSISINSNGTADGSGSYHLFWPISDQTAYTFTENYYTIDVTDTSGKDQFLLCKVILNPPSINGISIDGSNVTITKSPATFTNAEIQTLISRLAPNAASNAVINMQGTTTAFTQFWPVSGQSAYTFTDGTYEILWSDEDSVTPHSFHVTLTDTSIGASWNEDKSLLHLHANDQDAPSLSGSQMEILFTDVFTPYTAADPAGSDFTYNAVALKRHFLDWDQMDRGSAEIWNSNADAAQSYGPMYDHKEQYKLMISDIECLGTYSYSLYWFDNYHASSAKTHPFSVTLYDILTVTTKLDGETTITKQNIDRGTAATVAIEEKEGYECIITGHDTITAPGAHDLGEINKDVNITVEYKPIVTVVNAGDQYSGTAYLTGEGITGDKVTRASVSHGTTLTLNISCADSIDRYHYVKSVTPDNGTVIADDGSFVVTGPTTITVTFGSLGIGIAPEAILANGYTGQDGAEYHYRVVDLKGKVLKQVFSEASDESQIGELLETFDVYVDGGEDGKFLVPLSTTNIDPSLGEHLPVNPVGSITDLVTFVVKPKSGYGEPYTVSTYLVESRTGAFTIRDPHVLNYKYGIDALPTNETIYNTSISAPDYSGDAISTHLAPDGIEYLARPAGDVTIEFGILNILGKEIDLSSQFFSLEDTWVPVQKQEFTIPTQEDLVVEALKSLGITEEATPDTISAVQDQIADDPQVLVDAIAAQMTYYGAHCFGDGTSEETLHVIYDTADTYINDYTVPITLEDPRAASRITANNIQKDYGVTFTEESLKEALDAKLLDEAGNPMDGELTYKIPTSLIGKPSAGKYTVTISFAGSETHDPCSYDATVTIKKLKCEIHYPEAIKIVKYQDKYDYALVKDPEDVPAIELLLGVNVGEVMENGEVKGVKPTLGVVIPTVRIHVFGDYYLNLNVPEGTYSLKDLTKKLEDMNVPGFGTLIDKLVGALSTITGATGIQDIEVIVSHTAFNPKHVGLYLTGAMTVSSNYETAYALGSIFIYPAAALETLEWVNDGPIFTEKELKAYIGSEEYKDTTKPPYLGAVTKSGKTYIDQEIKYITFSNTGSWYTLGYDLSNYNFTTMKDVKQPGKYRQLAYNISTLGNLGDKLEFVMPALRTFRIITSKATVKITDPRDQNFKHTYDGTPHLVNAQAYYSDGGEAEGGQYTITYEGNEAPPILPGTYKVVAKYHSDPRVDDATAEKTLTISQAKLTLEMTKAEKYYGQDDSAIVYEYKDVTGLLKDHTVAENGITIERDQTGEDAKENHYALKATIKVIDASGNDVSNCYTTELTGVKLTIKPAEVTITPKDVTKSVDAEDPEFTYDYEVTQGLDVKTEEEIAKLIKDLEITIAKAEEPRNTDPETGVKEYDLEATIGKKNPNLKITVNKGTLKDIPSDYVCWNMDTVKYYKLVSEGLGEAQSGQTVQMLKNATAAENQKNEFIVAVGAGVTFDLNGYNVETANMLSYGVVLDTKAVPGGILIDFDTAKAWTKLQPGNGGYLPVYDSTTGRYQFFKYTLNNLNAVEVDEYAVKFRFRIEFDNPLAYSVLAQTSNSGITLYCDMDWTGNSGFDIKYYIPENILQEYGRLRAEGNNVGIYLTAYGLEKLEEHAVITEELYVTTVAGVTSGSRVLSYTKPN